MTSYLQGIWRRNQILIIVLAVALAFVLGLVLRGGGSREPAMQAHDHAGGETVRAEVWTCSMHPNIRQPGPGRCPICGMDLIPVLSDESGAPSGPREIKLSAAARKLAEIRTAPVERKRVSVTLRLTGRIETDETREARIAAWVPGRLERVFIDYTGEKIGAGEPLVELYSPELLTAQQELLAASAAHREAAGHGPPSVVETARRTAESAREKLRLLGLTEAQIESIERRGSPSDRITITAPTGGTVTHKNAVEGMYVQTGTPLYTISDLSHLWVLLDAYESDLAWIRKGQTVTFEAEAHPGKPLTGTVSFVDPAVDPKTRTAGVRVELANPGEKLKPGMFVRAAVQADAAGGRPAEMPLVLPSSAPLLTGTRAVVYVELPGEEGRYEGREVVLGPRAGDYYIVRDGLREGEMVVVNGAFKIDSEIQIQAKPSMMSPEGGAQPVHRHGPADAAMEHREGARGASQEHGDESPVAPSPAPAVDTGGLRHGKFDVAENFQKEIAGLYDAYFETHAALSRDDLGRAKTAAGKFARALDAVAMDMLSVAAHEAWMADARAVREGAAGISSARDIAAARAKFEALSGAMYEVATGFGIGAEDSIFKIHCPMAFDNRGADWLQTGTEVQNPYFGSMMFTCGTVVDTILGGARRGHE